jgi:hypothetical protein
MDPNRQKQEEQKPAHLQQRRSIVEGMARTGIIIIIIDVQFEEINHVHDIEKYQADIFISHVLVT